VRIVGSRGGDVRAGARPPDVERISIVGSLDRAIRPDWSRRASRELLGVEAVEIGTAHSPMLARPAELADLLV
jgi:hypothetical protein